MGVVPGTPRGDVNVGGKDPGEFYNPRIRKITRKLATNVFQARFQGDPNKPQLNRLTNKFNTVLQNHGQTPGLAPEWFRTPRTKGARQALKKASRTGYY